MSNKTTCNCQSCDQVMRGIDYAQRQSERISALEKQNAELLAAVWAKQAAIDLLMLEYCPNEMSPEQIAEWAKHQRPSTQEVSE